MEEGFDSCMGRLQKYLGNDMSTMDFGILKFIAEEFGTNINVKRDISF